MSNRLYVGNLAFHATEDLLAEKFGQCGPVRSVSVMTDRETGRSRGFAFVEMETVEGAEQAIAELDGQQFEGRALRVNVAEDRKPRGGGGGFRGGGGGGGFRDARGGRRRGR